MNTIILPEAPVPVGNYVPYVVVGKTVYISGQIPILDGKVKYTGRVGEEVDLEQAQKAARLVGLNILAQAKAAAGGDLKNIKRCVKIGGFVYSTPDFTDQPAVINGISDLMVEVLGEKGKHTRFAVSAPSLPRGVSVEADAVFELV